MIGNDWIRNQTNATLRSTADVAIAVALLEEKGLPLHPDRTKNWDNFLAIHYTRQRCSIVEPVLDAGAGDESAYLPGLRKLGYNNLIGINLDRKDDYKAGVRDGIRYAYGDITSTPFPNNVFGFVSCLSVIEHGVDWQAFFAEMSRIMKVDAHLFISFDYWPDKLNTTGLITHDAPINIFSKQDVTNVIGYTHNLGLHVIPEGPVTTEAPIPMISWAGLQYTFMNLLFRKDR